ncbi:response regulator transcription factor [Endozoicomonas sp. SM1973]|uniref:Response regulator transcription factor n=1 Tax=Spartinivicinus marinus TaxID=2994442 RepID=A0A853I439_9GAMM|nr:response regulator transcription factor [Spartinivicinus marinus]MCX4028477.1 response regulator transcription factor [Spartinivicinus marinus]NYZ67409.1 response regulator transcription factor [Spartinivicinus marinus]
MQEQQPTVFIIDDDEAVRDSLGLLMQSVGQSVEVYASPADFLAAYNENRPGCIVMDIRMPGMSGLELQAKLNEMHCILPIIFITGHGDVQMAVQAIKNGAMNFIQKPFRDQELLDLINDGLKLDSEQRKELLEHKEILKRLATLTDREREVLHHVVEGKANKVIAADISLSQRTVEIHRSRVMEKMGTKSLAHLVRQIMQVKDQVEI